MRRCPMCGKNLGRSGQALVAELLFYGSLVLAGLGVWMLWRMLL